MGPRRTNPHEEQTPRRPSRRRGSTASELFDRMLAALLREQSGTQARLAGLASDIGIPPSVAQFLLDEVVKEVLDALWLISWDSRRFQPDFDPVTALLERIDVNLVAQRLKLPEKQVLEMATAVVAKLAEP